MLTEAHQAMADRLTTTGRRLEDGGARILSVWAYMQAGTHVLNAALHEADVTAARDEAASNHAGTYLSVNDDEAHAADPGDVIHTNMPPIVYPQGAPWDAACADLQSIEHAAAACLRSAWDPDQAAVAEVRHKLDRARRRLASRGGSHV
jgi:hypothetical protein